MADDQHEKFLKLTERVYPLCRLPERDRMRLAEGARLERLSVGTRLRASQEEAWLTYVVRGELDLHSDKGAGDSIAAPLARARMPVFRVYPDSLHATAMSDVTLVRFDRRLFQRLQEALRTLEGEDRLDPIVHRIYDAHQHGTLVVPSHSEMAARVRPAIDAPDLRLKDMARLLLADPALAGRVIQRANESGIPGEQPPVKTLLEALSRLGLQATDTLVAGLSDKYLFTPQSELVARRMRALYEHSTLVASLAYVLAKGVEGFSAERALLAGLTHDLGALMVLREADEDPDLGTDEERLDQAVSELRGLIGNIVLSHLGFHGAFISVAEQAEDWRRNTRHEPDYTDIVIVAQLYSFIGISGGERHPSLENLPAVRRLGLDDGAPEHGMALLQQARSVISSVQRALR